MQISLADQLAALDTSSLASQLSQMDADYPQTDYDELMRSASAEYGVPYGLLYRLLSAESEFGPDKVSPAGAQGIAQFMPDTAKEQGVDPFNPIEAIPGAAKYLKQHYDRFKTWPLAAAAYNAGAGNVKKYGGVPPFKETQGYIKKLFPGGETEYDEQEGDSQGIKSLASQLSDLDRQTTPTTTPPIEAEAPTSDARGYYSTLALSPYGVWSPEIANYMGMIGRGPKPEGGWDELGRPLDAAGVPYTKSIPIRKDIVSDSIHGTLKGLTSLVSHPVESARGVADFFLSLPGFMSGLYYGAAEIAERLGEQVKVSALETIADPSITDIVNLPGTGLGRHLNMLDAYKEGVKAMEETFEYFQPPKEMVIGKPTEESQLPAEIAMAPLNAGLYVKGKTAKWLEDKGYYNAAGFVNIVGDVILLPAFGLLLRGGRNKQFGREVAEVAKEANDIYDNIAQVQNDPNPVTRSIQEQALAIKAKRLETKAATYAKKFKDDIDLLEQKTWQEEYIAKEHIRPVEETGVARQMPEGAKPEFEFKSKAGNQYYKVGDTWYRASGKEVQNKYKAGAYERNKVEYTEPKIIKKFKKLEEPKVKLVDLEGARLTKELDRIEKELSDKLSGKGMPPNIVRLRSFIDESTKLIKREMASDTPRMETIKGTTVLIDNALAELRAAETGTKPPTRLRKYDEIIEEPKVEPVPEPKLEVVKDKKPEPVVEDIAVESEVQALAKDITDFEKFVKDNYGEEGLEIYRDEIVDIPKLDALQSVVDELGMPGGKKAKVIDIKRKKAEPKVEPVEEPKLTPEEALERDLKREEESTAAEPEVDYITELDRETGTEIPELDTGSDSFIQSKARTDANTLMFRERAKSVQTEPTVYVQKLVNDVNRWLHEEEIDIAGVRDRLSEMATRADEFGIKDMFLTPKDHLVFKEVASEASAWAKSVKRSDKEPFARAPSPNRLNSMIPLDEVPDVVGRWFEKVFGGKTSLLTARTFGSVYRNKRLWQDTGFWLGRDGKWRYEIDSSKAKIKLSREELMDLYRSIDKDDPINIQRLLDYPELYKAVPEIKDITIFIDRLSDSSHFVPGIDVIRLNHLARRVMLHEVQHGVNDKLNAFKGTSTRAQRTAKDPYVKYLKTPGEMESRLVENRIDMTAAERKAEPPWETLDKMLKYEEIAKDAPGLGEAGVELYSGFDPTMLKKYASAYTPKRVMRFVADKFPGLIPDRLTIKWLSPMQIPKDWPSMANAKFDWVENTVYIASNTKRRFKEGKSNLTESQIAESLVHELGHMAETTKRRASETWKEAFDRKKAELGDDFTYAKWKAHPDEFGPTELGRKAKKMFDEVLRKEFETGVKLYDIGGATVEGMKKLIARGRRVSDYTKEARAMKSFKPKAAAKMVREEFNKSIVDRSGNLRTKLLERLGDEGYRILQQMVLAKGSSSKSATMLKQMRKEVYSGLNKHEKQVLDSLLLSKRMIAIRKYKDAKEFIFPKKMDLNDFLVYENLFDKIEKLTPERAELIRSRAQKYFDWMKIPLKDALDAGLISKKEYTDLSSHNYRKIELVDIFDKKRTIGIGRRARTIYDSGVESLQRGKSTDIYEPSSQVMALEVFNRMYGRIYNNKANNILYDLALRDPTNPFVRIRTKENKIPMGWKKTYTFRDGKRETMHLSPETANEWIVSSPEISYKMAQVLKYTMWSPVLRTFATGINWGFALANLPRDVMHTWYAARTFENGKWKPVYSSNAPSFGLQIGRDLASVAVDAWTRGPKYQAYINEGGGMQFLTTQGRPLRRGKHIDRPIDYFYNFMGHLGETSEMMTRLAIRDRVIRNQAKKRGISVEEASKIKEVTEEATFAARDYMDFAQGGGITKAVDNALPYLNAGVQGTRGLARAFKPGSGTAMSSTYKLAQFAALTAGIYIAAKKMAPETMKNMTGNVAGQNNLIIPLGDHFGFEDDQGNMRYPIIKIPLDPGQKFFKTFFEAATDKWLGNEVDVNRVVDSLKEQSPVGVTELPPSISGALGYVTNKDFWMNEDIWRRTKEPFSYQLPKAITGAERGGSEEEYLPGRTPEFYKDLGATTGLSPERTRYAVEELTTSGTVWSYLLGQGYEELFSDMPERKKEQHLAVTMSRVPVVKRFFGITSPYTKYEKKFDEAEEKAVIENFTETRGLDALVDGYLYEESVPRGDIFKYIKSFKDKDTRDKLYDRFKWEEAIKRLPEKSFWRKMHGIPVEARAEMYVYRLDEAGEEEYARLRKEYRIITRAGGVVSKRFRREVRRLLLKRGGQ